MNWTLQCAPAHPILKTDLEKAYPTATFVYSDDDANSKWVEMLELFDAGECDVLAMSEIDTRGDTQVLKKICDNDLRFTKSVFIENVSTDHLYHDAC